MHTQINIPTNSESGILPQQRSTNTFQKDKSKLLDRVSIDMQVKHYSRKTDMI